MTLSNTKLKAEERREERGEEVAEEEERVSDVLGINIPALMFALAAAAAFCFCCVCA